MKQKPGNKLEPMAGHADGIMTIHHPSGDKSKDVKVRPLKLWNPDERVPNEKSRESEG